MTSMTMREIQEINLFKTSKIKFKETSQNKMFKKIETESKKTK